MNDILILGSTSNICKIRVLNNLNTISHLINKIYCYSNIDWTTNIFINYINNSVTINNHNNINSKINYICGEYNLDNYILKLHNLLNSNTIIYVSTPPICYNEIIDFINFTNVNCKVILEKPLSLNLAEFKILRPKLNSNISMIDHFLYKKDVINVIKKYKNRDFRTIKLQFNYTDDLETRINYMDKVGFFIDMFQSHFLTIIYLIIGKEINDLISANIIKNIKKQYINYSGKNNIDTYFYLELKTSNKTFIFEAGKAMKNLIKRIIIDDSIHVINNYENEYELYFLDIINNNIDKNIINYQEVFWNISEYIINDFKKHNKLEYYRKNKLISNITIHQSCSILNLQDCKEIDTPL